MTPQSTLTERYVAAAVRSLPENQREDVERELRASIEDDIDARIEAGGAPDTVERDVLTELGDPGGLAARYAERPLYLIGPTNFLVYRRLVVLLVAIIAPIAAVGSALAHALSGEDVGAVIAMSVTTALGATMHIAFWTTLVFAILDWTGASKSGPLVTWTPDALPELPERRARLGDTIASLVFLALLAGAIVYQQFLPIAWNREGAVAEPFLDPVLWGSWIPVLLGLIVIEAAFTVAQHRAGGWTWPLAIVNIVIGIASAGIVSSLALAGSLINPAFLDAFPWGDSGEVVRLIGIGIAVIAIATAVWDAVDGIVRTIRASR